MAHHSKCRLESAAAKGRWFELWAAWRDPRDASYELDEPPSYAPERSWSTRSAGLSRTAWPIWLSTVMPGNGQTAGGPVLGPATLSLLKTPSSLRHNNLRASPSPGGLATMLPHRSRIQRIQ